MSYADHSKMCGNRLGARLLAVMDLKKTNVALSADVTTSDQLIKVSWGRMRGGGNFGGYAVWREKQAWKESIRWGEGRRKSWLWLEIAGRKGDQFLTGKWKGSIVQG